MKKIISIKAIQLLVIDGIMLALMRKTKPSQLGFSHLFFVSRIMVTGPSLTSSTCISAPKIPV